MASFKRHVKEHPEVDMELLSSLPVDIRYRAEYETWRVIPNEEETRILKLDRS